MKAIIGSILLVVIFTTAFNNKNPDKPDVLAANMDTSINPGEDFFEYANGGWIKKNPIPDEESGWGIGNLVLEENLKRLRTINEDAAKKAGSKGSNDQKIGDFWKAAMDSVAIEKKGTSELQPYLKKIDAIKDPASLSKVMAELNKIGLSTLVGLSIQQDDMNSDVMAIKFWQSGLFLPDREYYLKTDKTSVKILNQYKQYLAKTLAKTGLSAANATSTANDILKMETSIAKVHRKLEDLRDPYKNYNKMSPDAFYKMAPSLQLDKYLTTVGIKKVDSVIVGQPEYYKALDNFVKSTPINTWKAYLKFNLIDTYAEALPESYGVEKFNFTKLLTGAKQRRLRWKRVLRNEEGVMGELLGQLYVKEYFNETAKKRYTDLVEAIRTSLKERIQTLDWMSDSTKQKAQVKLAAMKKKVGYPDKWKDFTSLQIVPDSYLQNLINGNIFWLNYNLNKLGKPVDRDEWDMTPQTYNAYYNPSNNEIVLPAGIFTVPGYRDEELDDAVVYGYAGASTIGHEITHGFDDQGRQYDEKGNLKNWWTAQDEKRFNERAAVMIKQFGGYVVVDTFKINGKATLGENIADLGGILLGWDAFKKTDQFKKNEMVANLSPSKRYFLGYALGWLGQTRNEELRNRVMTDVHSPAKFRVNGPFADVDAFYQTFGVQQQHKMFIADTARVRIW
jgi:putative endopeptidase